MSVPSNARSCQELCSLTDSVHRQSSQALWKSKRDEANHDASEYGGLAAARDRQLVRPRINIFKVGVAARGICFLAHKMAVSSRATLEISKGRGSGSIQKPTLWAALRTCLVSHFYPPLSTTHERAIHKTDHVHIRAPAGVERQSVEAGQGATWLSGSSQLWYR